MLFFGVSVTPIPHIMFTFVTDLSRLCPAMHTFTDYATP